MTTLVYHQVLKDLHRRNKLRVSDLKSVLCHCHHLPTGLQQRRSETWKVEGTMAAVNYKRLSQKHLAAARQAGTRKAHAAPRTRVDELSARLRHLVRDEAARLKASTLQKKLHLWFKAADRDRNGYVNLDEFRSVVYRLRRANTEFTDTVQRH